MQPLVSIITPTFNHAKYIADCINSVKNQTYPNWEMIIVNDGSADNTAEIVKEFADSEPRIKFIDQENVGIFRLGETYNKALENSTGKYIAILEGDDIWASDKLERQVAALEQDENRVVAWGRAYTRNADLSEILGEHPTLDPEKLKFYNNTPKGSILNLLYFQNYLPALTILIRRSALEEIGGFHQGYGLPLVDLPTLLELSLKGTFYFDANFVGSWRIYARQVTKTYPVEIYKGIRDAVENHFEKHKEELSAILLHSINEVKRNFHKHIQISYARAGRYKLIRKEFTNARKDYVKAIFYPGLFNLTWRLRATIGYFFSLFKTDVEGLAKVLGKKTYRIE